MKYRQFEDLPVWKDSAELARRMYEFSSLNQFTRHPGLRDQLERAGLSVSNNIAEGFERESTNELLVFLYIARGSAGEVRSMLKILDGWSDFSNLKSHISETLVQLRAPAHLISKSENISRQLYGWIESLKHSGISGQRHLDEKARTRYSTKRSRQDFLEELDRINLTEAEKRQTTRKPTKSYRYLCSRDLRSEIHLKYEI